MDHGRALKRSGSDDGRADVGRKVALVPCQPGLQWAQTPNSGEMHSTGNNLAVETISVAVTWEAIFMLPDPSRDCATRPVRLDRDLVRPAPSCHIWYPLAEAQTSPSITPACKPHLKPSRLGSHSVAPNHLEPAVFAVLSRYIEPRLEAASGNHRRGSARYHYQQCRQASA